MSEEEKVEEQKAGGSSGEPQIDRAAFEEATQKAKSLDELNAEAKENGFESFKEYTDFLLEELYNKEQESKTAEEEKKVEKPPESQPKVDDQSAAEIAALKETVANLQQQSAYGIALSQHSSYEAAQKLLKDSSYEAAQKLLKEEEQNGYSKDDLDKIVFGVSGQLAKSLALDKTKGFNGNLYEAAAYIKRMEDGVPAIRKTGAQAEANRNKAEASAFSDPGGKVPAEEEKTYSQEQADLIAPDDATIAPDDATI
jgi:hypothetical protein